MSRWIVSADLGQTMDPTAVAVMEVSTRQDAVDAQYTNPPGDLASVVRLDWFPTHSDGGVLHPRTPVRIDVRHLERLPLRMHYLDQVAYIASLLRRHPLGLGASLAVDQTGVGRPIVELFRRAGLQTTAVTITAGDKETRSWESGYEEWRVAKILLVSHLQACLNEGTLRIAPMLREARALVEELQNFRANISETTGYTRFGAREGTHDDLVLAVAIGAWWAGRQYGEVFTSTVYM